jgi:hypothetical protein
LLAPLPLQLLAFLLHLRVLLFLRIAQDRFDLAVVIPRDRLNLLAILLKHF